MLRKLLLFLLMPLLGFTASAYDFKVDGIYYNIISSQDLTCEVTYKERYKSSYTGDIIIPSTVIYEDNTFSVTSIGDYTFMNCDKLKSIEIPNSIISIGDYAFMNCEELQSIEIPHSIISIGDRPFYGCLNMASFTGKSASNDNRCLIVEGVLKAFAPANMTSYEIPTSVSSIGNGAFFSCSGLTSVKIPNSVTSIGIYTFANCKGLKSIEIPNSVTLIDDYAFCDCRSLTSLEIPNSVTSIGDGAFYYCEGLTSLKIGYSISSIGDKAFNYCTNLAKVIFNAKNCVYIGRLTGVDSPPFLRCDSLTNISIGEDVENIPNYIFYGCKNVNSLKIPNSVTSIGDYAFFSCSSLTSVKIPNSVTSIGSSAFYNCEGLTSVKIGNSVTSIGSSAFKFTNLTEVSVSWDRPNEVEMGDEAFTSLHKVTLYVPIGTTENYKYRSPWNNFKEIKEYIPGGTEGNEKCAIPVISVDGDKLVFTSLTPEAKYYYTIECDDEHPLTSDDKGIIELKGTYQISVYAYADGYDHSDIVTATLVWVNPQIEEAGIISMEAKKAILLRANEDIIVVSGLEFGEQVMLYDLSGRLLENVKAKDNEMYLGNGLQKGQIYIVKVGGKSVKIKM